MKKIVIPGIFLVILNALIFYTALPVISFRNPGLWFIILLNIFVIAFCMSVTKRTTAEQLKAIKVPGIISAVLVLFLIIGGISSTQIFHASAYTKLLDVQMSEESDLPSVEDLPQIPLMDTESSKVLGNRKIGALSDIVSQFEVSDDYMTIAYHNTPVKVSPLRYASLWKWAANRGNGIPGYVIVDPNGLTAEYTELEKGMKYVPSAYFSEDLNRHIYGKYPTVFFESPHFEIDDEGKAYYVAPTYTYTIGIFGGKKITGAIVVDPVNGSAERYETKDLPEWVDIVYNGDYISKYFDIRGKLVNGFWNSVFGQKGLIESATTTTYDSEGEEVRKNDFGYIVKDNDVYVYTGVTSVTNDESNIGYYMANERNGEIHLAYFESTDEDSVMRAAEGEVQEKRYRASFPSLVNIDGAPAYVMVLKDNLGLVKMYAIVDASQYSHMEVAETLDKALAAYSKGSVPEAGDLYRRDITIRKIEFITVSGDTKVYIVDEGGNLFCGAFDERTLLWNEGDTVNILTDGKNFRIE